MMRRHNPTLQLAVLATLAVAVLAVFIAAYSTIERWNSAEHSDDRAQANYSSGFEADARSGAGRGRL